MGSAALQCCGQGIFHLQPYQKTYTLVKTQPCHRSDAFVFDGKPDGWQFDVQVLSTLESGTLIFFPPRPFVTVAHTLNVFVLS